MKELAPGRYSRLCDPSWRATNGQKGVCPLFPFPPFSFFQIRSSPAIAYIADSSGSLDRWVFITTEAEGGKLLAFKTDR